MKILIVTAEQLKQGERYADDKGWSFRKAFEKLGIKVDTFIYKKKGNSAFIERSRYVKAIWRAYMNKKLIRYATGLKPDILLISKGETITPDTLLEIRKKTDTQIINIFPDNPLFMGKFEAIGPCHYFFVKDSYVLDTLWKAGLKNVFYLPQCTDPDVHKPIVLDDNDKNIYSSDVSLIGSMYPYRMKLMEQLVEFKPTIWGRGWSRAANKEVVRYYRGKDVRGQQKAKAICGTAISLNPHHPLNDINGVNRRTYDIAACRGFQLADYKADTEKVFRLDREIVCYKTLDELKKLIDYYLARPEKRAEIAEAAYQRVLKEHTYDVRAGQILDIVSGKYS